MLFRFKFIPLILLLLTAFSNSTELGCGLSPIPKDDYGEVFGGGLMHKEDPFYVYKLSFDKENELYMYKIKKDGSGIEVYHYARLYNNHEITSFNDLSTQTFYKIPCSKTYPDLVYPLKKFDKDPKTNRTKYIIDVFAIDTDFKEQRCELGYDLANHKCADDCEHITDHESRFDCACKKKGGSYNGVFSIDPAVCKTPDISFTPKCCFSCGNGLSIVVNSVNEYADYGCNYDETDHLYLDDPTPNPDNNNTKPAPDNNNTNPKPDKPDENPDPKPDKPDKPNPDHGGGGHIGGGGTPENPDKDNDKDKDKNGTRPGGGSGKPGDKEDKDDGKFDPKDFDDGGLDKARDDLYGSIKDHLNNLSKFDGIRDGIDQFIKNVQGKGFDKVQTDIKRSCPIKKQVTLSDGKSYEIEVDYCDAVAPASEISYYVFYGSFVVGIFLLLMKLFVISI